MFLKTLEASGFKSFPDKTVLAFEKGITAVVGPNGSGKSNIADAISWVLGEQSTKQLRGEKMEDVIFNGTASRSAQGMAYVTICFDNTDRSLRCESDEVYITRRYYRSGESRYEINHSTVRLKDINELFMDTGIGRDGYSMIGQGRISEIVSKRSDERRDMFEEAAGISRYRYRKQEAERKLSATEENLVRLRDILGELEQRVGPLGRESAKAQSFLEYSGEKKQLEIGLWLYRLGKIKEQSAEHEKKIFAVRSHYSETEQRLTEMNDLIEAKTGLSQEITVRIDETLRSASAFEEQAAVTDGKAAVARNDVAHLDENIERLKKDRETALSGGSGIDAQIDEKQAASEEIKRSADSERESLEKASLEFERFVSESDEMSRQCEDLNREIAAAQNAMSLCDVKKLSAESAIEELGTRAVSADAAIAERNGRIESLSSEISALSADLDAVNEKITGHNNSLSGLEMLVSARREKAEALKNQIDETILDSQTKKRRALMLREMERNMDEFNHSVKAVMRDSRGGILGGIRGPVSRLISVPAEYSVAIEIALGNAMQNIVVNNENDAKRAIELLKRNKEGRATFLPLSTVKRRVFSENGLDGCIGFVGMACDLVKREKEFDDVVSSLLGAIAVAEDLDSAVAIARKYSYRFKIVTLDGQVVNSGGSMTGGSLTKNAGILGRSAEIEKAEKESAELDKKAAEMSERHSAALSELSAKTAESEAVKAEIITAGEDKIRLQGELKRVSEQKEETEKALLALNAEKQDTAEKTAGLIKTASDCESEKQLLGEKTKELEEKLCALSGGQDELSSRRQQLTEQNAALRMRILSLEKDKEALDEQIESLNAMKQNASGQIESIDAEIAGIEKNKDEQLSSIEQLEQSARALREQAAVLRDKAQELTGARLEAEEASVRTRKEEKELISSREQLSGELARLTERKEAFVKDSDDIVAKLYDEYELTRSEAEQMGIVLENQADSAKRLSELKNKIRALGSVNVSAIEEYKEVAKRYEFLNAQVNDVETSKNELLGLIDQLTGTMQGMFAERFNAINAHFSHTFVDLFGGGTAELKLTDPIDVLNSGIDINVQPPGKKVSSIEQLSGGEKSLVAIAIYFAMMKVSPPPFCMLDEVESALDDVNVDRFAAYLRRMCDNTQFVIVTHRRGSMEEADVLYGVTMQEKGVSKLLQLKINEVEGLIK